MGVAVKKGATLREQVVEAISSELRQGTYQPGERITEQGLAERLQVSRTPIREALNQLLEQGAIHARPRGGYVVPSPTVEQVRQIIAVRTLLEPPAVAMAAREYGPERIARINDAIHFETLAKANPDHTLFAAANEQFRRAIFDGIENQILWSLIAQFASHLDFIRAATLRDMDLRLEILARQEKVRDAITAHDDKLAEALWTSYLALSEATLIAAIEAMPANAG